MAETLNLCPSLETLPYLPFVTDEELKDALRNTQTMVKDADLVAEYFKSKDFRDTKDKVKSLIPASLAGMLPGSSSK